MCARAPVTDREVAAVDHPVFDHEGPWTESAFLALPRDGRVEVVDGTLLIGPGATEQRTRVVSRVRAAVRSALPEGLQVRGPVPLRLGTDCVLVPDLVVTAAPGDGEDVPEVSDDVLDAAAALMVIEVVGSDHGVTDRSFKPQLYARSGIPYSLVIDHDGPFAVADMIISGRYHEYARAGDGEQLRIEEPFVLELDLATVTRPGAEQSRADPPARATTDPERLAGRGA
ncbi:Uma2 family endonuclease [Pseudonocardia xinjiangensis]